MAGELLIGRQVLRKGDGMFIPAGAGYAYQAGAKGVEVLEFRGATHFSFLFKNNTPAHWQQIADVLRDNRSEEHASELQSLMRISYAVFRLKKKNTAIAL